MVQKVGGGHPFVTSKCILVFRMYNIIITLAGIFPTLASFPMRPIRTRSFSFMRSLSDPQLLKIRNAKYSNVSLACIFYVLLA